MSAETLLFLSILFVPNLLNLASSECRLRGNNTKWTEVEKQLLQRLEPLKEKVHTTEYVNEKDKASYIYKVGICKGVSSQDPMSGAIQITKDNDTIYSLGLINNTEVMGGSVWISLQYYGGNNYIAHCTHKPRLTDIMIICDESATTDEFRFVEERREFDKELCFYQFELKTAKICPKKEDVLSFGSIFCIIFFSSTGLYFLFGLLYHRIVVGAKGLEQIPNYSFWQDFGNLQAVSIF
ncbi:cation-dependent mannose-6-phosphate receptor-like isoform X2 [Centruroides vittatus]|uniref:cation-dependent mannose-6-phosphate receptor-like isoform X2 n=1 Tax=Centruroides vittatus TaxID=120091 RepID=UPI00350F2236